MPLSDIGDKLRTSLLVIEKEEKEENFIFIWANMLRVLHIKQINKKIK